MAEHRKSLSGPVNSAVIQREIRRVMHYVASEPMLLLEVIAGGLENWDGLVRVAFAPYPLPPDASRQMFRFFALRVVQEFEEYAEPGTVVDAAVLAKKMLDNIEPATGPTQAEIDAAWVIEDLSSEGGKREYAEQVGESPQEHLAKLIQQDRDKANADGEVVH